MRNIISLTFIALMFMIFSGRVNAVSCTDLQTGVFDNETDLDSIASACLDANTNNDSEAALNFGEYFGISTWTLLAKTENGGKKGSSGLYVDSVGEVSGTFSFDSSYWGENDHILVVLKGGVTALDALATSAGKPEKGEKPARGGKPDKGVKWSAYMLEQDEFEGFWIYGHGNNGQLKDLSHLSLYGSGVAVIPIPASLWLFASGLIGLVAVARNRIQ